MSDKQTRSAQIALYFLLIIAPVIIGLCRDITLEISAKRGGIQTIAPTTISEKTVTDGITKQTFTFALPDAFLSKTNYPSIGYYGAFAGSYISINGKPLEEIRTKNDIVLSWFKFHTHPLTTLTDGIITAIDVNCVSPIGTKKIGMDKPALLIGSKRGIDALAAIFNFFSIHIYLVAAFVLLAIGIGLRFTDSVRKSGHEERLTTQTLLSATALFFYSHFFDQLLIDIGTPKHLIEIATRLFIGPVLAALFVKQQKSALLLAVAYLTLFIPGILTIPGGDSLILYGYRWLFLATTLLFIRGLFTRYIPRICAPFAILMISDTLALHGLVPLTSGLYTWVLGLPGLFLLTNVQHLKRIIDDQRFIYRLKELSKAIERIRRANSSSIEEWQNLLKRICISLSQLSGAERISISYLLADRPVILLYQNGVFRPVNDGKLPRRLARVIQTKQPLWFVDTVTLSQLAPPLLEKPTIVYKTDFACLLPIVSNNEVFGALSLTDFTDPALRKKGPEQEETTAIISRFLEQLAQLFERKTADKALQHQRHANEIITLFSQRLAVGEHQPKDVIKAFINSVTDSLNFQALYFTYDPSDSRLHLLTAKNLSPEIIKLWADVPFRAAKENLHAPFPIAINNRQPVYVGDIRTLDNVLVSQSVSLFEKCQTRSLYCAPIQLGDRILGLLCLLNQQPHNPELRAAEYILDSPLKYLALALHNAETRASIQKNFSTNEVSQ